MKTKKGKFKRMKEVKRKMLNYEKEEKQMIKKCKIMTEKKIEIQENKTKELR